MPLQYHALPLKKKSWFYFLVHRVYRGIKLVSVPILYLLLGQRYVSSFQLNLIPGISRYSLMDEQKSQILNSKHMHSFFLSILLIHSLDSAVFRYWLIPKAYLVYFHALSRMVMLIIPMLFSERLNRRYWSLFEKFSMCL